MTAPTVSVVIPAYNAARTVRQAVTSALEQSRNDLEVIVVDDGSTDGTADVVRNLGDPRLRLVSQENSGAAAARNAGTEAASGRWVAFLDADDLWLPTKLETQLGEIESTPGAMAVQSSVYFVDDRLRVLSVERCSRSRNGVLDVLRFRDTPAAPSTLLVDRQFLQEIGGFDQSLVILEDWDLMIRIARNGGLVNIEEPLAFYRVHPGNRSKEIEIHVKPGLTILRRLFADPLVPDEVLESQREVYARFYTMLAGGAFRGRSWGNWAKWSWRAVRTDPRVIGAMAAMPYRRLRRLTERTADGASGPSHLTPL
jgi:glycosyltransferase involved in cell wall biosynthesis